MNYTMIIEGLITLLVGILTAILLPYIKGKMSAADFAETIKWVKIAVQAAEMIFKESGLGEKKKKYVEDFLESHGITYDAEQLDALIESAVLELKRSIE